MPALWIDYPFEESPKLVIKYVLKPLAARPLNINHRRLFGGIDLVIT
jgi:hypothetical protein